MAWPVAALGVAAGYAGWEVATFLLGPWPQSSPGRRVVALLATDPGLFARAVADAVTAYLLATAGWVLAVGSLLALLLAVERFRFATAALAPAAAFAALTFGAEGLVERVASFWRGIPAWGPVAECAAGAVLAMLLLRGLPARGPAILRAGLLVAAVLAVRQMLGAAPRVVGAAHQSADLTQEYAAALMASSALGGVVADAALSRIVLRIYAWRGRR